MPGTRCTVAVCNNSFEKTKKAGMSIMYHQFPKSLPIRNIWIEKCRRAGEWNPSSCHVCSIHFTEDDYKDDSLTSFNRRRLKSTAVPSLFLREPPPLIFTNVSQRKRKKKSFDDITPASDYLYLQVADSNTEKDSANELQVYKVFKTEDSTEEDAVYKSEYENDDLTIANGTRDSDSFYYVEAENDKEFSESSGHQYVTIIDCFTQTDDNYFSEDYKQLVDRNKYLENELVKWKSRCKKLMSQTKLLESRIQRFTIKSEQL